MRAVAALALAAAALAMSACGSDGDDSARKAVIAAAVRTDMRPLALTETARVRTGAGEYVAFQVRGNVDGTRHLARVRIDARRTDGGAVESPTARGLANANGDWARRGDVRYARLPALGNRWVVFDPTSPLALRTGLDHAAAVGGLDGTRPLDQLRATDEAQATGRSGSLTRYRITIDYGNYARIAEPQLRPNLKARALALERGYGTDRFPADVWIGASGLVARVDSAFRTKQGVDGGSYRIDLRPATAEPRVPARAIAMRKLARR